MHFHHRHLVEPQHLIVVIVGLHDRAVLERQFAVQRHAQTEGDARFHLRRDTLRIHRNPAVHRTDHAMHANRQIVLRHLRHLRHVATERLVHCHAQRMAIRQWCFPVSLFHRQIEHAQMPRMILEQGSSVLDRILARRRGHFIDQRFHDKTGMAMANRAQPQHIDARLRRMQIDLMIGQAFNVRTVGNAFDRGRVDAVFDHRRLHQRAGHDRLPDQHVLPARRQAISTQTDLRLMEEHRTVITAANIVFTRPHGFHRHRGGFRHLHRLGDEV
ncbi:hypothetical protein D3C81_1250830 [compost metagenome]